MVYGNVGLMNNFCDLQITIFLTGMLLTGIVMYFISIQEPKVKLDQSIFARSPTIFSEPPTFPGEAGSDDRIICNNFHRIPDFIF